MSQQESLTDNEPVDLKIPPSGVLELVEGGGQYCGHLPQGDMGDDDIPLFDIFEKESGCHGASVYIFHTYFTSSGTREKPAREIMSQDGKFLGGSSMLKLSELLLMAISEVDKRPVNINTIRADVPTNRHGSVIILSAPDPRGVSVEFLILFSQETTRQGFVEFLSGVASKKM